MMVSRGRRNSNVRGVPFTKEHEILAMIAVSTLVAGSVFVGLAAANVTLMLEASRPSVTGEKRSRLIHLHRIGGYLFVVFFCIMAYVMSQRLVSMGLSNKLPTYLIVHVGMALLLIPLLGVKI